MKRYSSVLRFFSISNPYAFVLFLASSVGLAWIYPDAASKGGWLHPEVTTKVGVFVIFILQGLSLPMDELRSGLLQYRTHILIEGFIFLFIPSLVWFSMLFVGDYLPFDLRMGFLFLAIVPTTISSSVVFTTQAGGSAIVALFNASASNVLGIFLVPLWVSWQIGQNIMLPPVGNLIMKIIWMVLVPLVLGQILRRWTKAWADRNRKKMSSASMGLILFIVFCTFSHSVRSEGWKNLGGHEITLALAGVLLLLLMVMACALIFMRMARFRRPEGIAFFFSATQKALSTGIPMAHALFDTTRLDLALILIPLMLYHPLQLLLGSFIVGKFARGRG